MERLLWLLSGSDSQLTRTLMERFSAARGLKLPEDVHRKVSSSRTCACLCLCKEICRYQSLPTHFQKKRYRTGGFPTKNLRPEEFDVIVRARRC